MKIIRVLAAAVVLGGVSTSGFAARPDDQLAALQNAITTGARSPEAAAQFMRYVPLLRQSLARGNYVEVEQFIENMRGNLGQEPVVLAALDQLAEAIRADRAAKQAASEAALDDIIADVRAKVTSRESVKDFDALLERLAGVGPGAGRNANGEDPLAVKVQTLRTFISRWQDYLALTKSGSPEQVTNILNQLAELATALPIIPRSEFLTLQSDATARAAATRDSRLAAARAQFDELTKKIADTLDRAKTTADLDPLLAEIAKVRPTNENGSYNPAFSELNSRCETARRFVLRWQDYMSQLEGGNASTALTTLNSLASDNNYESLYPRSRILARINGRSPTAVTAPAASLEPPIALEALTLDNLDPFIAQWRANYRPGADSTRDVTLQQLESIRSAVTQLKLGNSQTALNAVHQVYSDAQLGSYALAVAKLKQQLLLRALPLHLQIPESLQPIEKETPTVYLQRVITSARGAQGWELVYRVLQFEQANGNVMGVGGVDLTSDIAGYRDFFTGLNQERAGQFTAAVRSYLSSLRSAGPNLPAEEIGRRLKELKASHPQEFASAESPGAIDPSRFLPPTDPRLQGRAGSTSASPLAAPPSTGAKPAAAETPPAAKSSPANSTPPRSQ